MKYLFLKFETRGVRNHDIAKVIKINGFAQSAKDKARVEFFAPKSSYLDSGTFLPEVDLSGIDAVVLFGSTYTDILSASVMWFSDRGVKVCVVPELIVLLLNGAAVEEESYYRSIENLLGDGCIADMNSFFSGGN